MPNTSNTNKPSTTTADDGGVFISELPKIDANTSELPSFYDHVKV
jgi:hypothetical protein